jgi:hypothetical protein
MAAPTQPDPESVLPAVAQPAIGQLVGQLPPAGAIPHTFRALRHRNFRLFITGQIISLVGT